MKQHELQVWEQEGATWSALASELTKMNLKQTEMKRCFPGKENASSHKTKERSDRGDNTKNYGSLLP